jgi:hypothetical protein
MALPASFHGLPVLQLDSQPTWQKLTKIMQIANIHVQEIQDPYFLLTTKKTCGAPISCEGLVNLKISRSTNMFTLLEFQRRFFIHCQLAGGEAVSDRYWPGVA